MRTDSKMSCARCGKAIAIHEYINYAREITVLRERMLLHFCKLCHELVIEYEEEKIC